MSYLKRILNNCQEVSILSIKKKEDKLSFKTKIEMAIHIAFCNCCKNFQQQSEKIDDAIKYLAKNNLEKMHINLSAEFKDKLKLDLKNLES